MRFGYNGWFDGADDCDPPEPGKEWLAITDDGEEIAVVVLRTDASIYKNDEEGLAKDRSEREQQADLIAHALNTYTELVPEDLRELAHKEMEIAQLMGPSDDNEQAWLDYTRGLVKLTDDYLAAASN